jgi:predicted nucleic acid-binding protein
MAVTQASRNVVDSSGWIEYFTESPNAEAFAPAIEDQDNLIVPSLSLVEVFRWLLRVKGEDTALQGTAVMQQGHVVDLNATLAPEAARIGHVCRLPLADSVIYATARACSATLWTQDGDFAELAGVRYLPK